MLGPAVDFVPCKAGFCETGSEWLCGGMMKEIMSRMGILKHAHFQANAQQFEEALLDRPEALPDLPADCVGSFQSVH